MFPFLSDKETLHGYVGNVKRACLSSFLIDLLHQIQYSLRDLLHMRLDCKVAGVEHLHFCVWIVPFESFGSWWDEEGIVLAPDGEQRRL